MEPLLHFMLCQKCLQEGHLATLGLGGNKKKRPFEKHTENTGLLLCYPFISISISLDW